MEAGVVSRVATDRKDVVRALMAALDARTGEATDGPKDVVMAATTGVTAVTVANAMIEVSAPMAHASVPIARPTQLNLQASKPRYQPWSIARKLAAVNNAQSAPGATRAVSAVRHADRRPRLRSVRMT
jgi:hypothetical protein